MTIAYVVCTFAWSQCQVGLKYPICTILGFIPARMPAPKDPVTCTVWARRRPPPPQARIRSPSSRTRSFQPRLHGVNRLKGGSGWHKVVLGRPDPVDDSWVTYSYSDSTLLCKCFLLYVNTSCPLICFMILVVGWHQRLGRIYLNWNIAHHYTSPIHPWTGYSGQCTVAVRQRSKIGAIFEQHIHFTFQYCTAAVGALILVEVL